MTATDTTPRTARTETRVPGSPSPDRPERASLRLAATLAVVGEVVFLISGLFHPDHAPANNHTAAFTEYAASTRWAMVHIGQFVGMTLLLGGVLTLLYAINVRHGRASWLVRFAAVSAIVTIGLYAVLQAVDGVALKHAVDSWAGASLGEKVAAFRAAEAIRWLEWGVRSFANFMQGASLLLLAGVVLSTRRLPRAIGVLAGVAGLAYLVDGYVLNTEGFSMRGHAPGLVILVFGLAWVICLTVFAWRSSSANVSESSLSPADLRLS
jgi:uncharacterized membrane protein HdeD (DUF308 family)